VLEAIVGFLAFLLLAFLRVPLWIAMLFIGFLGFAYKTNHMAALSMIGQLAYETAMSYTLSVVPLFVLMGNLVTRARLSEELYDAAYSFFGHLRGGLAMSTIVACAGFSAICGSSLATAATMGKVAYPSMKRFGYKDSLAAGSIAAGGTLGILIPP
jgi:C4-dicarboxylate transporter, DctM subunit